MTAVGFFAFAATKKITDPDVALENARRAYLDYDVEEAREMYDEYTALMKKKKKTVPDEVEEEMARLVLMENMLSRVEKITVVDSLVVDADGFFQHYRLSPEAGKLVSGDAVRMPDVELAYVPQNNSELLYAEADTAGNFVLMGAGVLDDGTVDRPAPLRGDDLAGGGNAEYPFLMSDGLTLYFANDGDGSIGGYDIFLTRRDDGSFLQPQNIGMPYNSPYDDYLLAIDENTGVGWWATDRNRIPGKVTIYVFEISDSRVNVADDDDNLVAYARLDSIALTQQGRDISRVKRRIAALGNKDALQPAASANAFELAVGSADRIYRSLSDFRSTRAKQAMAQAIDARIEVERIEARLAELRAQWSKGNKNSGITILNLEQQLADARQRLRDATNLAISEELKTINQ